MRVRGARENNPKNISLNIPRRQITVFSGVSGSGKSSLVVLVFQAEADRIIVFSLSTQASRGISFKKVN